MCGFSNKKKAAESPLSAAFFVARLCCSERFVILILPIPVLSILLLLIPVLVLLIAVLILLILLILILPVLLILILVVHRRFYRMFGCLSKIFVKCR